jgi:hypothetical protein
MTKLLPNKQRIETFFKRTLSHTLWNFDDCPDHRQHAKVTHPIQNIVWSMLLGMMANRKTLRDIEELLKELGPWAKKLVSHHMSDTTLYVNVGKLPAEYFHDKLVLQIKSMHRKKQLRPDGLPYGIATIDGKNLATLAYNPDGQGHARDLIDEKWKRYVPDGQEGDYYLYPALRATLSSNPATPALYHMPLPPGTGESRVFHQFLDGLHQAYGALELFRLIDVDAGFTSWQNAQLITAYGYYYVMGLKENQPTLLAASERIFQYRKALKIPPLAETPWEKRGGKTIRRQLWITTRLEDFTTSSGQWSDLRQVWYVRQETKDQEGWITVEHRYFLSSVPVNDLTGDQILRVVRRHWAVENDVFNSLDLQWREDHTPYATGNHSVHVMGVMRLIAFNLVQFLRKRHLCPRKENGERVAPLPWRNLFETITEVLKGFVHCKNCGHLILNDI